MIGALFLLSVQITVARDGGGDFTTVQQAVDSVRSDNKSRVVILIKPRVYKERISVPEGKPFVTFRGEDAGKTILTWDSSAATDGGTSKSASVYILADDFEAENITFANSYGTGSQAVAAYVSADRAVFRKCRFLGRQDTLYANGGRQRYEDCYIEGHVDFIFGNAAAVFENCEIHSLGQGYVTAQSRVSADQRTGYVFDRCRLTGENTGKGVYLGRPWRPFARVVYLNCWMDRHIRPEGWENWRNPANEKTASFAEYRSTGPGANPGSRETWSRQLSKAEADAVLAEFK